MLWQKWLVKTTNPTPPATISISLGSLLAISMPWLLPVNIQLHGRGVTAALLELHSLLLQAMSIGKKILAMRANALQSYLPQLCLATCPHPSSLRNLLPYSEKEDFFQAPLLNFVWCWFVSLLNIKTLA